MKRKILSVLFAVVLVLSFSLVTAVPVAAATDRLVPSEYATIQAAINAADAGDTILVAANLTDNYTENLNVTTATLTIQGAGSANTTVEAANPNNPVFNVTASGVTIKNFTITGATNAPGVRLDAGSCTIDSNNITGNKHGIWVTTTQNKIRRNTITGNTQYGIRLPGATDWNRPRYNDITNNGSYGVYAEPVPGDPNRRQWAGFNYWGDADGPGGVGLVTTGDEVNENVWYNPWLNQPFSTILASGTANVSMGVKLEVGWNTLATPLFLDGSYNQWDEIVTDSNLTYTAAYTYDAGWSNPIQTTDSTVYLDPLDAMFIQMASPGIVTLRISTLVKAPPTRDLKQGWNLMGASMAITKQDLEMWQVLKSVDQTKEGDIGYDMVVSPQLATQPPWVYVRGEEGVAAETQEAFDWEKMKACRGYWIYMENADELAGFGATPITAKIWD